MYSEKREKILAEIWHGDRAWDDYVRTKDPGHLSLAKAYWGNAGMVYADLQRDYNVDSS